jgi:hypothetical protein
MSGEVATGRAVADLLRELAPHHQPAERRYLESRAARLAPG